jgi:SNF2 family DNA or RNA helicase
MKTYGSLEITNNKNGDEALFVFKDLEPHVVMRLKQIFTKIAPYKTKTFSLPFTDTVSADIVWFTSRYPMRISKSDLSKLKSKSKKHYKKQNEIEEILLPNYSSKEKRALKDGFALRDYQGVAVDVASKVKKMLLVDEMGLGKTIEGLAMGLIKGNLPIVFVVEAQLQIQWGQMAEKFVDLSVHLPKGNTPYSLPKADVYIFKYSQLSSWADVLSRGWVKAIVFDEVQNLRTGMNSAKGIAAKTICDSVDFIVGMTGTLVYNYGIECWNIANIIKPGLLGTKHEFLREWCTADGADKGIVKDPDALGSYLREENFLLRRTRADIGEVVRQKKPEIIKVSADKKSVGALEDLLESLAVTMLTSTVGSDVMSSSSQFDLRLRQLTGISKAKETATFVRMLIEQGSPVLLFGYHREVYRIWEEELGDLNPAWFTGSESISKKEKEKQRFLNGETDLIIMSLHSGAGVDGLQKRCKNAVFGELDWSKSRHQQCISRVDRAEQMDDVYVYFILSDFGSDPVMVDLLGVKSEQSRGIQDPGVTPLVLEADKDRVKNMARNYLKSKGITVEEPKVEVEDASSIL